MDLIPDIGIPEPVTEIQLKKKQQALLQEQSRLLGLEVSIDEAKNNIHKTEKAIEQSMLTIDNLSKEYEKLKKDYEGQ